MKEKGTLEKNHNKELLRKPQFENIIVAKLKQYDQLRL